MTILQRLPIIGSLLLIVDQIEIGGPACGAPALCGAGNHAEPAIGNASPEDFGGSRAFLAVFVLAESRPSPWSEPQSF